MEQLRNLLLIAIGLCAVCEGNKRFEKFGDYGPPAPVPDIPVDIPDVLPPEPEPPRIQIDCIGKPPCRQTWPKIDYKPSLPNYDPVRSDKTERFRRQISEETSSSSDSSERKSTVEGKKESDESNSSETTTESNIKPKLFTFLKSDRFRVKRSPLVVDQGRSPVIVPYFCHKMPCSGPLSSFPPGKRESSGRYELPERGRKFN